jgi:hypothetical protein
MKNCTFDFRQQFILDPFRRTKLLDKLLREVLHAWGINQLVYRNIPERDGADVTRLRVDSESAKY